MRFPRRGAGLYICVMGLTADRSPPRDADRGSASRAIAALVVIALAATATTLLRGAEHAPPRAFDFDRDIRPVLAGTCLRCHGGVREMAGLHLGERGRATSPDAKGRIAVVPGDPNHSELLRRITMVGPKRMPPTGEPLDPQQIEAFRRWILAGAEWKPLWSLTPIENAAPPTVDDARWPRAPLDRFVLSRLDRIGLRPNAEADRTTLLRRVSLDLIGLPPTVEELDAFLADRRPDAYERVVDRLLASPHFGERWARPWLDIARYADTQGYEKDDRRTIWAYRDWVITALNADMPYDRFVVTQLAGDLLPDATDDDRIATAFHRNTLTNTEGGTDDEEFRMAAVFDRVAVTWNGLLGTTFQCVQCHSHPYDAFSQEEYYRFVAFLNQTADADRPDESPTITVRSPGFRERSTETTTVPVMSELPSGSRRTTHLLERGSLKKPSREVLPGTPAALPPMPADAPRDRLGLARWVASAENPLFARVAANRIWETLFGRGIVETVDDFGSQGAPPTNRELLDHLASRYVALGFSTKSLLREIALSSTYRQSSVPTREALVLDPTNRLWSRAPRYRLEAEAVRDATLAVAGLLSERMYGPSVMPSQPDGVWAVVYSGDQWSTSAGEDRHRRGIYTFWRRSSPYPAMVAFDAPSRETCTPRRIRSNSPLAALATLNDPAFIEAARSLAKRSLRADAPATAERDRLVAAEIVRHALLREARDEELDRLVALADAERARLAGDPAATRALADGDDVTLAAWTVAANAVLNLDEFLSRS